MLLIPPLDVRPYASFCKGRLASAKKDSRVVDFIGVGNAVYVDVSRETDTILESRPLN